MSENDVGQCEMVNGPMSENGHEEREVLGKTKELDRRGHSMAPLCVCASWRYGT